MVSRWIRQFCNNIIKQPEKKSRSKGGGKKKSSKGSSKKKSKKSKDTRTSEVKSPVIDPLSPAAMLNAYYIAHGPVEFLQFRGYGWKGGGTKKSKKGKKKKRQLINDPFCISHSSRYSQVVNLFSYLVYNYIRPPYISTLIIYFQLLSYLFSISSINDFELLFSVSCLCKYLPSSNFKSSQDVSELSESDLSLNSSVSSSSNGTNPSVQGIEDQVNHS